MDKYQFAKGTVGSLDIAKYKQENFKCSDIVLTYMFYPQNNTFEVSTIFPIF